MSEACQGRDRPQKLDSRFVGLSLFRVAPAECSVQDVPGSRPTSSSPSASGPEWRKPTCACWTSADAAAAADLPRAGEPIHHLRSMLRERAQATERAQILPERILETASSPSAVLDTTST
jgi:hypothetical protein